MTTSGLPSALQEKNEQEFVEVTRRIKEALAQIERDPKLRATQDMLAKLADCSRGTLNNRKWPLVQLRNIKAARKAPVQEIVDETAALAKEKSRIQRYKQQLDDSREEVLFWKTQYDDAVQQLAQARDLNRILQERLAISKQEFAKRRRAPPTAKVVQIPTKQRK